MVQWRAKNYGATTSRRSSRPSALEHGLGSVSGSTPEHGGDDQDHDHAEGEDDQEARGDGEDWWEEGDWYPEYEDAGEWCWEASYGWFWVPSSSTAWTPSMQSVAKVEETTNVRDGKWVGSQRSWSTRGDGGETDPCNGQQQRSSEKLVVPSFTGEGADAELGVSARSYLRKVEAWTRCTKMVPSDRAVALYSNLGGKAWVMAEELDMDLLAGVDGMDYFTDWIRVRFMEMEVTKISNVMSELFRKCRRRPEQAVRDFNVEFERMMLRGCEFVSHVCGQVEPWDGCPACLEIFAGCARISEAFGAKQLGVMKPVDIVYGDNLRDREVRQRVLEEIDRDKPALVWMAPPCTEWCAFSRLNYTKQERRRRRKKERVFMELVEEVIIRQRAGGRDVVVENPMTSDIWTEPILSRWCQDPEMSFFRTDLCQFGMKSVDGQELLRKPVKLLATNEKYQETLARACCDDHEHRRIQGKETSHSSAYPMDFAKAVVVACEKAQKAKVQEVMTVDKPKEETVETIDMGEKMLDESGGASDMWFKGTVSKTVGAAIKRLHQNLGHLPNRELARHLRLAGAGEAMVEAATRLQCRTCQSCAPAKPHKVSKPAALLDFNEAVAMDIMFLDTIESTGNMALSMVDVGSNYHVVIPIPNRKSSTVADVFYRHWIAWAGVPGRIVLDLDTAFQDSFWDLTSDHSISMRAAAGQAHWQNGIAERYGSAWKDVWAKLCAQQGVRDVDMMDAACAVSEARNTLRNRSGFSPRQWVFGSNGKFMANFEDDEDYSMASAATSDMKMGRKHALRVAAKIAYFENQNTDAIQRALQHKARVRPRDYAPGDMVYIHRDDPSGKKHKAKWIGPAVVIGSEGSNYWCARGGRCLLAAREHLRTADHEEVSFNLRLKAALKEVEDAMDVEFEDEIEAEVGPSGGPVDPPDIDMEENPRGRDQSQSSERPNEARRRKAFETGEHLRKIARRVQALDDVPVMFKRNTTTLEAEVNTGDVERTQEVMMAKKNLTGDALEKSLDKEIPWNLIPADEKALYVEAEDKQWKEHLQFGAVKPLSVEESAEVERTVGKDRILNCRFLYRDKNRAKRRLDDKIPCKPKARLCVGGQRDPDLGVVEMSVDAPTASRYSILVGLMVALARGWCIAVGDIRAAFLNGVEAPRNLYFRQPVRGIPGLRPSQLIEIRKGVFGLATSPKLWWLKLSQDLCKIELHVSGKHYIIEQNEVDPCCFRIVETESRQVYGMLFTHVDDIMVMTDPKLFTVIKDTLAKEFPIDEWEADQFEYVGNEYLVTKDQIQIKQTVYTKTRVEKISIPQGSKDEDEASEDLKGRHRSVVGALSWLAKQTRPDLQFSVAQAQRVQDRPTIGDLRNTNKAVEMARKHADQGIVLRPIPEGDMAVFAFHDAAWGNTMVDNDELFTEEWDGNHTMGSQLGSLVMIGDKSCLQNREGPSCIVDWRSKASTRVCRSTFAGETMACGDALESAQFVRALLVSFLRGKLVTEDECGKVVALHLFTDCKSLFDHLHKDGIPKPPSEKRLAIELAAIRQGLATESKHQWAAVHGERPLRPDRPLKPPLHWLPTDQQWADVLTKKMNAALWWTALGEGRLRLPFTVPNESSNAGDSRPV